MSNVLNSKSIRYPNTFSISQGITLLSEYCRSINESINLILSTAKGELFGDPEFGSNLYMILYDTMTSSMKDNIKYEIANSLNKYEKRIFVSESDITVNFEGTTVKVNIVYNLRYTDYRESYVYITKFPEEDSLDG